MQKGVHAPIAAVNGLRTGARRCELSNQRCAGGGHEGGDPLMRKTFGPAVLADDGGLDLRGDQRFIAAADFLRHEDARAGNVLRAGVDGQHVVHACRPDEIDLHVPDDPDDLLATLAFEELGMPNACEPEIVGAAALEEFEIACVIDDAGEVVSA
jgi:hypothetical protein